MSVIQNPKQHSKGRFLHYGQWVGEKPPSAQRRVDVYKRQLMGDVPRVELFARQTAPGWDVWGNEVEPTEGLRDILSQRKGG